MYHYISKCPFCGGISKVRRQNRTIIHGETVRNTFVYCPRCDARGGRVLYRDFVTKEEAEEKAVEVWNKRACRYQYDSFEEEKTEAALQLIAN